MEELGSKVMIDCPILLKQQFADVPVLGVENEDSFCARGLGPFLLGYWRFLLIKDLGAKPFFGEEGTDWLDRGKSVAAFLSRDSGDTAVLSQFVCGCVGSW